MAEYAVSLGLGFMFVGLTMFLPFFWIGLGLIVLGCIPV